MSKPKHRPGAEFDRLLADSLQTVASLKHNIIQGGDQYFYDKNVALCREFLDKWQGPLSKEVTHYKPAYRIEVYWGLFSPDGKIMNSGGEVPSGVFRTEHNAKAFAAMFKPGLWTVKPISWQIPND